MSKDKQIGEMAKVVSKCVTSWLRDETPKALLDYIVDAIYNAGYRNSTEIFEEIEHSLCAAVILLKFEKDEKIRNIKNECYTGLIGYLAELKNKCIKEDTE